MFYTEDMYEQKQMIETVIGRKMNRTRIDNKRRKLQRFTQKVRGLILFNSNPQLVSLQTNNPPSPQRTPPRNSKVRISISSVNNPVIITLPSKYTISYSMCRATNET